MESLNKISQIELTNNCTGKCEYCPYQRMTRPVGYIKLSLIEKIAKKISGRQNFVHLFFFGESAFHPEICEIVKILKKYKINSGIYVNSKNLTIEVLRNLERTDLKEIYITIDNLTDFKIIQSFSRHLNIETKLTLITVKLPKQYRNRMTNVEFYRFVNSIKDIKKDTRSIILKFDNPEKNDGKEECCRKIKGVCDLRKNDEYIIMWDGRITTCLKDFDGKMSVGTIDDLDDLKYESKECPFK